VSVNVSINHLAHTGNNVSKAQAPELRVLDRKTENNTATQMLEH